MLTPRFFHPDRLHGGDRTLALDANAARHVQVLRLQPGASVALFDGHGGEYPAVIERIGRSDVRVQLGAHDPVEREAAREVHLAVGMPANERMDWLVEKATELGAASIQPLITERGVLRLAGERAEKKRAHWQGVAVAACEQCGRNRVLSVHPVLALPAWLAQGDRAATTRWLLSLREPGTALDRQPSSSAGAAIVLSGPEGGFGDSEERAALAYGFVSASLGTRVLRAETAALAALCRLAS